MAALSATPPIRATALLLGERLELRGLSRAAGSGADPVILPGGAHPAFAFRGGALVPVDASAEQRAALLAQLSGRIANPLLAPLEEGAWISAGAERDEISETGEIRPLGVERHAQTIVPEDLDRVAAAAAKHVEITRM